MPPDYTQKNAITTQIAKFHQHKGVLAAAEIKRLDAAFQAASADVQAQLAAFQAKTGLKPWQQMRVETLRELQFGLKRMATDLKNSMGVNVIGNVESALTLGIEDGVSQLQVLKVPDFAALSPPAANLMVMRMFSVIDRSAVEMLATYRIQLLGDVADQLVGSIQKTITAGILTGKSTPQIAKEIGMAITDKEAFKKAGKTVFKTAQQRAMLIAHTEVLRAHNEGRKKFYEKVGVKKIEWLTATDEVCPECQALNGKTFDVGKAPGPPKHPDCRCTVLAVIPDDGPLLKIPESLKEQPTPMQVVQPPVAPPVAPPPTKVVKPKKVPKPVPAPTPVAPPPAPPVLQPAPPNWPLGPVPKKYKPKTPAPPPVAPPVVPKAPAPPVAPAPGPKGPAQFVLPKVAKPVFVPSSTPVVRTGGFADDSPLGGVATQYMRDSARMRQLDQKIRRSPIGSRDHKRMVKERLALDMAHTTAKKTMIAESDAYMRTHYTQFVESLTHKAGEAISYYTGHGYDEINKHLRKGNKIGSFGKQAIAHIDEASKVTRLDHPMDVFRGFRSDTLEVLRKEGKIRPGAEIVDKGVISTSLTPSTPHEGFSDNAGVVLRIRLRTGQPVLFVGNNNTYAKTRLTGLFETEVLLPRNTRFRVLEVGSVEMPGMSGEKIMKTVMDVEVIDD